MKTNQVVSNISISLDVKQAERQLGLIKNRISDLKKAITQIESREHRNIAGDADRKALREYKAELKQLTNDARELAGQIGDVSDVIKNISAVPVKALRDALRTATRQMDRLDRSTEDYVNKKKEVELLRAELDKVTGSVKKQETAFGQIGGTIKRLASCVLVYAGFNELMAGLRKMYDMNVELSDQLSDIQKTTGLSGKALANLSEEILKLDTRTSVEQLNNLAVAAGKLGLSAEEDVMGFVRAGNMINVALGKDLGEDAITQLSKLNDILGITKRLGVEQALLSTGSAINELGQKSTANEAYLVDFAQRMGGIAAQSKLTIQQVLALGSAADQAGQNVEVAATAINKVITTLVSKTSQVAKAIGVSTEELRAALDQSTWDGLLLVFEKLASKGGLAGIAPLMGDLGSDGARLNAVIASLTSDTNKLKAELDLANGAFAEGISVVNEYEKKNNNLAGTIEKIGKNIQRRLMGSGLIEWMLKVASGIERFTRGSDSIETKFKESVTEVRNLTRNIAPLLEEYEKLKETKAADEQERLKNIMKQIGAAIPSAVSGMDEYGNILSINTERAKAYIESQKLIMRQNNQALIKETNKTIQRLEKEYALANKRVKEIGEKGYYTIPTSAPLTMTNNNTFEKVTDPKKLAEQQTLLKEINEQLNAQKAILAELDGSFFDADLKRLEQLKTESKEVETITYSSTETDKERKERIEIELASIELWLQQKKNALSEARLAEKDSNAESYVSQQEYMKAMEALEMEALRKKLAIRGMEQADVLKIEEKIYEIRRQFMEKTEKAQAQWKQEYDRLQQQLGIRTEDKDKQSLARIQAVYDALIAKAKEGVTENYKAQEQITRDIEMFEEQRQKAIQAYWATQDLQFMDEQEASDKADLREMFINRQMDYEEYLRQVAELEMQYAESRLNVEGLTEEQITKLRIEQQNVRFNAMKQAYDKEKQLQKMYADVITKTFEGLGGAIGALATGSQDAMKEMGDALIDTLFDSLSKMVNIWLLELDIAGKINAAMGATKEIGTKGLLGLATAALVQGIITGFISAAKSAVKGLLGGGSGSSTSNSGKRVVKTSGYSVGGYTSDGPTYEVAGVVHRGEYVVPKWQMQDPVSFDYVRALEAIRQTRSHQNRLSIPRFGYAEGGMAESTTPNPTDVAVASDSRMFGLMNQLYVLLNNLNRQGVKSIISLSRFEEQKNRYDASRQRGTLGKKKNS